MQLFCGHAFDNIVLIYLKIIFKFEPINVVVMLNDWRITAEVIVIIKRYRNNSVMLSRVHFGLCPLESSQLLSVSFHDANKSKETIAITILWLNRAESISTLHS